MITKENGKVGFTFKANGTKGSIQLRMMGIQGQLKSNKITNLSMCENEEDYLLYSVYGNPNAFNFEDQKLNLSLEGNGHGVKTELTDLQIGTEYELSFNVPFKKGVISRSPKPQSLRLQRVTRL